MIEIRNRTQGPVQLVVKSFSERREHSKALTVKNILANETIRLPDERVEEEQDSRGPRHQQPEGFAPQPVRVLVEKDASESCGIGLCQQLPRKDDARFQET